MRFTGIRHTEIQGLPFTLCFLIATISTGLHAIVFPGWKDRSRPRGKDAMERRLTAILTADVVGYSRLMEADGEVTVSTLSTYREIIEGLVASHHRSPGGVRKTSGDPNLTLIGRGQ